MKKFMRNQKGFTLIEIIAVLVILGILAAVAIPKYFDMQTQANQKAALGALAEGKARINQYAAQYMMSNATWPSVINTTVLGSNAGDFSLSYATAASSISITAVGAGTPIPSTVSTSGTVPTPGTT